MATGKVKWFNELKGIGFITQDDGGRDAQFRVNDIQGTGNKVLVEGQPVSFNVEPGSKGPVARNVVPMSDEAQL